MEALLRYVVSGSLVAVSGCAKDDDNADDMPEPPAPFELDLELDGAVVHRVAGASGFVFVPGSQGDCNMGITVCANYQESVVSDSVDVNDRWRVGLIKTFQDLGGSLPNPDSVNTMVSLGSYPFGKFVWNSTTSQYDIVDGVRIQWTDPSGVEWSTDRGAADQSASVFTVSEKVSTGELFGPRFTFKCSFNCVLYNGTGESKGVSAGYLFGPIITG